MPKPPRRPSRPRRDRARRRGGGATRGSRAGRAPRRARRRARQSVALRRRDRARDGAHVCIASTALFPGAVWRSRAPRARATRRARCRSSERRSSSASSSRRRSPCARAIASARSASTRGSSTASLPFVIADPRRTSRSAGLGIVGLADLAQRLVGDPSRRHELHLQVQHPAERRRRARDRRSGRLPSARARAPPRVSARPRPCRRSRPSPRRACVSRRALSTVSSSDVSSSARPSSSRAPSCAARSCAAAAARSNHAAASATAFVPPEPRRDLPCERRHALQRACVVPRDRLGNLRALLPGRALEPAPRAATWRRARSARARLA